MTDSFSCLSDCFRLSILTSIKMKDMLRLFYRLLERFYNDSNQNCIILDSICQFMTFQYIYVNDKITSYYISKRSIILFIKIKNSNRMIEQINENLKQIVPYYKEASDLTCKTYKHTFNTVHILQNQFQSRVNLTKKNILDIKRGLENEVLMLAEQASNEILTRTEKILLTEEERPSEKEKKQIKQRFVRVFNKIVNDYVIFYAQEAKNYNMALIKKGQQYVHTYILPMYIKLKATLIVAKQILLEWLESGLGDMRMTYQISKDTVTMLIGGKFEEDMIVAKISNGMENFKELTVRVVKKGLQIKVDKKSLYENYEIFSLKVLEVIRQMREKGAEQIVSAKQKTAQLYRSVLNRIREKEITLKMEYKELSDKKETELEKAGEIQA